MIAPGQPSDETTLQQQFELFHAANPHVYEAIEKLARQWLRTHSKVGLKLLLEVARWELALQTIGKAPRLNNNWTSRYARLLLADHPEWTGRIETRQLRAA